MKVRRGENTLETSAPAYLWLIIPKVMTPKQIILLISFYIVHFPQKVSGKIATILLPQP
jgi:hypothetical protein